MSTEPDVRLAAHSWSAAGLAATWSIRVRGYVAARSQLVFNTAVYLTVTAALSGLWKIAINATGGEMVGYTATALVWYIVAAEVAVMTTPSRIVEVEGDLIIDASVETEMLRPVDLFTMHLAGWTGDATLRIVACMIVGIAWGLWYGGAPMHVPALVLAGFSLVIAVVLNIAAQIAVGAITFWVRDSKGAWFLYQKFVFVLGGMLLPLEVLPDSVATVARWLPFMAMAYVPARLAAGFWEPGLVAVQIFWLIVVILGGRAMYRRGVERMRRMP